MTRRVILTPLAEADIRDTQAFYEQRRSTLGSQFVSEVDRVMQRLERDPLQFPVVMLDVRRALVQRFPYGVFYRVDADGSVVIACLHNRREPQAAMRRALGKPEP